MFGAFVGATVGLGVAGAKVGVGMGVEGAFVAGAGVAEWVGSGATVEVILAVSSTCAVATASIAGTEGEQAAIQKNNIASKAANRNR